MKIDAHLREKFGLSAQQRWIIKDYDSLSRIKEVNLFEIMEMIS